MYPLPSSLRAKELGFRRGGRGTAVAALFVAAVALAALSACGEEAPPHDSESQTQAQAQEKLSQRPNEEEQQKLQQENEEHQTQPIQDSDHKAPEEPEAAEVAVPPPEAPKAESEAVTHPSERTNGEAQPQDPSGPSRFVAASERAADDPEQPPATPPEAQQPPIEPAEEGEKDGEATPPQSDTVDGVPSEDGGNDGGGSENDDDGSDAEAPSLSSLVRPLAFAAAWQPQHVLTERVGPGEVAEYFVRVEANSAGKRLRGEFFVSGGDADVSSDATESSSSSSSSAATATAPSTSSSAFAIDWVVIDPSGSVISDERGVDRGDVELFAKQGIYAIRLTNPSRAYDRVVSLGLILGRDEDDALLQYAKQRDTDMIVKRISALHQQLDPIVAEQRFLSGRFRRHSQTQESTQWRVAVLTSIELIVLIVVAILQVVFIQRLKFQGAHLGGAMSGAYSSAV